MKDDPDIAYLLKPPIVTSESWERQARGHGLSLAELTTILERQAYRCAVCEASIREIKFAIDHDHACHPGSTGCFRCVRGVLCYSCNTWLTARLTPAVLRRAADYLEQVR
jgi:hypothetical protein